MRIQSSAQIGIVIRNAIAFNTRNWQGDRINSDSLIQSIQNLFTILEERKIDYVLVGGIALLHYVEGRNTQVLDILMALSALDKLPEFKITHREQYFVRAEYEGLQIDVLLTTNPLFKRVHGDHAQVQHFLDGDIPIATVEGLLLLKLYALPSLYRQGNFSRVGLYENDIATLLYDFHPDVSQLITELSGYVSESDLAEIKNILADIQKRIQRFKNESE